MSFICVDEKFINWFAEQTCVKPANALKFLREITDEKELAYFYGEYEAGRDLQQPPIDVFLTKCVDCYETYPFYGQPRIPYKKLPHNMGGLIQNQTTMPIYLPRCFQCARAFIQTFGAKALEIDTPHALLYWDVYFEQYPNKKAKLINTPNQPVEPSQSPSQTLLNRALLNQEPTPFDTLPNKSPFDNIFTSSPPFSKAELSNPFIQAELDNDYYMLKMLEKSPDLI